MRLLLLLCICWLPVVAAAQQTQQGCRKVTGPPSRILTNKQTGIMDTILARVSGHITPLLPTNRALAVETETPDQWIISAQNIQDQSQKPVSTATDPAGHYTLWLERGVWQFTVSGLGFTRTTFKAVTIGSGAIQQLDLGMGIGTRWILENRKK